jgi:hypothetical protein
MEIVQKKVIYIGASVKKILAYLAAACRPQALIIWTEMETARAARIPSAVLGLFQYLRPTSSKPEE